MKKISLIAVSAILASTATFASAATAGSMYGALDMGYGMFTGKATGYSSNPKDDNTDIATDIETPHSGKLRGSSKGFFGDIKFGYHITDEVSTDLTVGYLFNQSTTYKKDVANPKVSAEPKLKRSSFYALAGLNYHFLNSSSFTPVIGLGIGYGNTTSKVQSMNDQDTNTGLNIGQNGNFVGNILPQTGKDTKKTKSGFIYGLKVGVDYEINKTVSVGLNYNLIKLPKGETKIAAGKAKTVAKYKTPSLFHGITLGVKFYI